MKYNLDQNMKDMEYFFSFYENIIECDLSNFNSENVINMTYMFNKYGNWPKLNFLYIKMQNVTDMFFQDG